MTRSNDGLYRDLPQRTTYTPKATLGPITQAVNQSSPGHHGGAMSFPDRTAQYGRAAMQGMHQGFGNNYGQDVMRIDNRGNSVGKTIVSSLGVYELGHSQRNRRGITEKQAVRQPLGPGANSYGGESTSTDVAKGAVDDIVNRAQHIVDPYRGWGKPQWVPGLKRFTETPAHQKRPMDLDIAGTIPEGDDPAKRYQPNRNYRST